ncbi:UDP-N-acetylglucosamine--N-acetylmuramyl-(pentapeptide) pyrophosphoryl-undecaprenol N-acetylglucosamine transferase [Candidatus Falkowbacteria bacterium]|nr:UDP-N-acetylglucosamine--N-acetylmuramyl-(pentapeptide) pyrophosphoryl-undecaprenol N-acetylglucosamine transferase [Candidatus Falkowbacteria bacterium]
MKIILSGGGTIGSVSPLIAIHEKIKEIRPDADVLWLATKDGPEHKLISTYNIPVRKIFAGKLRRYFSFKNFLDPFLVLFGFFQSLFIISKFKPDVLISAGGFVSVPVTWSGWFLRRPSIIHQQDIRPGLANKLMAPFAKIITVAFEKSLNDFPGRKTVWVGNPARQEMLKGDIDKAYDFFKLDKNLPVVLVIGGGTGASRLNKIVLESLPELLDFCQVIHLTGGKVDREARHPRYHDYEFLIEQLKDAYTVADLVVTRAGMAALTELAALKKPIIAVPIPNSHQEDNAGLFAKNNAAIILAEDNLTARDFFEAIKETLADKPRLENLSRNIGKVLGTDAAEKIVKMII